jgi:hypothetical protein
MYLLLRTNGLIPHQRIYRACTTALLGAQNARRHPARSRVIYRPPPRHPHTTTSQFPLPNHISRSSNRGFSDVRSWGYEYMELHLHARKALTPPEVSNRITKISEGKYPPCLSTLPLRGTGQQVIHLRLAVKPAVAYFSCWN